MTILNNNKSTSITQLRMQCICFITHLSTKSVQRCINRISALSKAAIGDFSGDLRKPWPPAENHIMFLKLLGKVAVLKINIRKKQQEIQGGS